MNNKRNKDQGITLIALVITIIVLIILAGVSIAMLTGDNGLLKKVEEARISNDKAELREYQELLNAELKIDEYIRNENLTQDETIARIARNLGVGEENITGNLIKSADGKYGIMVKDDNSIEVAKYEDAYVSANYIEPTDESEFVWEELTDGTIWLKKYIGEEKSINIPDTIEGKRISKIGGDDVTQSSVEIITDENGNVTVNPSNYVSERVGAVVNKDTVKSIKFPSNVNKIVSRSFDRSELEEVFFTDGPEVIDTHAFEYNKIKRIKFPNNLIYIGDFAFAYNEIKKVEFNSKLKYIYDEAFIDNYLTSIELPNSIMELGGGAFSNNNMNKIIYKIKNGVEDTSILNSYSGRSIDRLEIPSGVTTIERGSIRVNKLSSIVIPESVQTIESYAIAPSGHVDTIIIKGKPKVNFFSIYLNDVKQIELNYENGKINSWFPGIYVYKAEKVIVPYSEDGSILESYRNNIKKESNAVCILEYGSIEEKSN